MRGSKLTLFVAIVGLGILTPFFTNMDFLNPAGAWPEKESIRIRPEPLTQDLDQASSRAPAGTNKGEMWSCSCAQMTEADCSKGYEFHSMSEALTYSIQKCGHGCDPACFVKRDGEDQGHPVGANGEELEAISQ